MQYNSKTTIVQNSMEITAGANAGTGATASIQGDETMGQITIVAGTGATGGNLAQITIPSPFNYGSDNVKVIITPATRQADNLPAKGEACANNYFELNTSDAAIAGDTYVYFYQIYELIPQT